MSLARKLIPLREYRLSVLGIDALIAHKRVRNLTISVHRDGGVRVTAPSRASVREVERALAVKADWIRRTQARFSLRVRRPAPEYVSGEQLRFMGQTIELRVIHREGASGARLAEDGCVELQAPVSSTRPERQALIERWHRAALAAALPELVARWADLMGVQPVEWRIRRMRTRWGTCNTRARRIWLNLELATVSTDLLEYVVVHELAHLLEPSHNHRFRSYMDKYLPDWRERRKVLNSEAVGQRFREG